MLLRSFEGRVLLVLSLRCAREKAERKRLALLLALLLAVLLVLLVLSLRCARVRRLVLSLRCAGVSRGRRAGGLV